MGKALNENVETVKPDSLREIIRYATKKKLPVFIEGKAGIGKSQIVKEVAKEENLQVIDMRAILFDIGDLVMKIPDKEKGVMIELVSEQLPKEGSGILFFDEFKQAPTEVRRMFYQLILDRKLGAKYVLPENWVVISASNLDDEIEQEELEAPLFDRFVMRVRLENSYDTWKKWAFENEIDMGVISFLEMFKDKFYVCDNDDKAILTPRRWEWVSNTIKDNAKEDIFRAILPPGISDEFLAYKKRINIFNDVDMYLEGKKPAPQELDNQYALASAVINKVNSEALLEKVLNAEIKGLNKEVEVFVKISALQRFTATKKIKNKMAILSKVSTKTRDMIVKTYLNYGWLMEENEAKES